MNFYKILFQSRKKSIPLYKQLPLGNNVIVGRNQYSIGVQYTPESYNSWLMDERIFNVFLRSSVKQLIMTNYKFLYLIIRQDEFNLNIVDCKFEKIEIDYFLQGEKIDLKTFVSVMSNHDDRILQVYFRSKNKHLITLKSNGVLGIDNELSEDEINDIKRLIDFLSFGPAVLV